MNGRFATYLILAGGLLAAPRALMAHPHGGEAGLPHEILHFFLGRGHFLPTLALVALAALGAGIALGAAHVARRLRAPARAEADPVRRRG